MTADRPAQALYRVILQPIPGTDPVHALRRALKYALRTCGLRCVAIETIEQSQTEKETNKLPPAD
jgi:hypothetical protein